MIISSQVGTWSQKRCITSIAGSDRQQPRPDIHPALQAPQAFQPPDSPP